MIMKETREVLVEVAWHPPSEGIFKININVAFCAAAQMTKNRSGL